MTEEVTYTTSTHIVLILFFLLVSLLVLLFFLYKKLNKDTDGEYTVRRMVYKEGGVRDQMRGAVVTLETHLGVHLWPRGGPEEDGEEMQDVHAEEGAPENENQKNDNSIDEQEERSDEECGDTKGAEDDACDMSSLESSDVGDRARLMDQKEAEGETEGKSGGEGSKLRGEEDKGEASAGTGLLIDLNQFSGSAIWSEEEGKDGTASDVTLL